MNSTFEALHRAQRQDSAEDTIAPFPNRSQPLPGNTADTGSEEWPVLNLLSIGYWPAFHE